MDEYIQLLKCSRRHIFPQWSLGSGVAVLPLLLALASYKFSKEFPSLEIKHSCIRLQLVSDKVLKPCVSLAMTLKRNTV